MLVKYISILVGSIDAQARNWLFKGLFNFGDVSLQIRKEVFYRKSLATIDLATIDLTLPYMFRKRTGYWKAYLFWMMLVKYNTCFGSVDVQEKNWLFKGLFSFVDVCLKIRKEGFYWKSLVLLVSGKDFKPK